MKDFSKYLFRAHSIGNIMGGIPKPLTERQTETYSDLKDRHDDPEAKPLTDRQIQIFGDLLSKKNAKVALNDPAKKYLEKLVWEEITGRTNKVTTKYFDKGLRVEAQAITLYSEVTDTLFLKNKERKENKYFTGECDNAQGMIRDIKASFQFDTFPILSETIPNSLYEWQMLVYMDLWELDHAQVIYCLCDTPYQIIDDELRRLDWKFNIMDGVGNIREGAEALVTETVMQHIFTEKGLEEYCHQSLGVQLDWFVGIFREIPAESRVKIFDVPYDEKRINQMREMVGLSREYMNKILEGYGANVLKLIPA